MTFKGTGIEAPVSPPIIVIVVIKPEFEPNIPERAPTVVIVNEFPLTVIEKGFNDEAPTSVAEVKLVPPTPVKELTNLASAILNI